MKVLFIGTTDFSCISLQHILNSNHKLCGVITIPDKKRGRGKKIEESCVKKFIKNNKLNVPLLQPNDLNDPDLIDELNFLNADIFVVVAYKYIPQQIWSIPRFGTFNLHASLLPNYRGAAPINWVLMNGETKTGVTTFYLNQNIDCGDIIMQKEINILSNYNFGVLYNKLSYEGANLVVETLDAINNGNIKITKQKYDITFKNAPKLFKSNMKINWEDNIINIHNKIRALSPHPCAWTEIGNEFIGYKILKISCGDIINYNIENYDYYIDYIGYNRIFFIKKSILVILKDGIYKINNLQIEGKKMMNAIDFINGYMKQYSFFNLK